MLPRTSDRLHMGHARVCAVSDALASYHRMLGKRVRHTVAILGRRRLEKEQMEEDLSKLGCIFDSDSDCYTTSIGRWAFLLDTTCTV